MERSIQDIKEEVKARTDIVELIGGFTRLKRSGKNWTGLCPFHADKNPSFSVNPLGFYKCFSCGESGDIFTFVQKKEGLDFVEALEHLCRRAGIPFTRTQGSAEKTSEREESLALNRIAVAFYQDMLSKSSDARNVLAERALLKPTQEQWEIGFAPPDWDGLVRHLERRRANLALAAKIDLIKERKLEGSGYYDTFRNRLIFPIHDIGGRVIAFGGRAISKEEERKYINSGQTILFDKSKTLYGLYFARKKLSGDTPAVFVEGYVDVIATHQAGFSQCVATLGTSMTEEHARMLARYSPKVIICYDADRAGIAATLRGASVWETVGVDGAEVRVARLPAGDDPDSILRRGETAAFQTALDNAVLRADFEIELTLQRHNLQTEEGRADALSEIIPILATIPTLTARSRYVNRILHLHPLNITYGASRVVELILADVDTYLRQNKNAQSPRDKGYPLTNEQNGQPLADIPPPPTYRQPNRGNWGDSAQWPYTREVRGKGDGYNPNGGSRRYPNRRDDNRPRFSDPTRPDPTAPALTGPEKAERQLLRALLTADWRTYILTRFLSDYFVTEQGKRLFALIARTPAEEDGSIDPATLFRIIEREAEGEREKAGNREQGIGNREKAKGDSIPSPPPDRESFEEENMAVSVSPLPVSAANASGRGAGGEGTPQNEHAAEEDPFADEEIPPDEAAALGLASPLSEQGTNEAEIINHQSSIINSTSEAEELSPPEDGFLPQNAKFSAFLREVVEDSPFLVSKELVNEAIVNDCIRRLKQFRDEQVKRELESLLNEAEAMPPEQRRAFIEQYHRKVRETRGSSSEMTDESETD